MIEILAYAFGIMYSPGPVNLLSLNVGLNGQFKSSVGFFAGVAVAMLIMFLTFGYTGSWLISERNQLLIGFLGCLYIGYLAYKIGRANIDLNNTKLKSTKLNFQDGLLMQLLNPKGLIATLPIATVQFPAAHITGLQIALWSVLLSLMAFGAPSSYSLMGARMSKLVSKPRYFKIINITMSLLLFLVAINIAAEHVLSAISAF